MEATKRIYIFLIIVTLVMVLIYAQGIIIPFILAILFLFLIRVIRNILSKIKYVGRLPQWVLTIISSVLLLTFLVFTVEMISQNIQQLSKTLPVYEANVNKITNSISQQFNVDLSSLLSDFADELNFGGILSKIFSTLTGLFGDAFMVFLYLIFLLLEEPILPKKVKAMYPDQKSYNRINGLIKKIDKSVSNYIAVKTLVSLITGMLSYFVLLIIGVDAPLFWSFLIFVLNFIPSIGSLIATLFPTIFAMLQFGDITPAILVLAIVGAIQLIMGNLVEPRIMGTSLNISPLVVFLTLALWGVMWGVTGMLLSVPITVIIIIIMSEFPDTRPIAVLLSQQGKINKKEEK
ncbi:Predicted PurR-regulated permease PerM [Tangfeifania diversioriginum]|uniref:Predicted PurR-regulated permease PerM n=1 Tax=Tangfeifania diversioriginum TaxID=1168035 RepID=A0A1M6B789_9BACT|nr:AI-2E family transporter [Tangfeifania diversioriginum]SHI44458.1 Predicted PurR-regulated permease PerM [Tangfeifania diversioriginum]